jgi:hypothetical protein
MSEFDEQVEPDAPREPSRPRHFGDFFKLFTPYDVEVRGEHAFHAAVRFLELIQDEIKDPEWQQTLLRAWLGAVKNRNFSRFQREYRRWKRSLTGAVPSTDATGDSPSE